MSKRALLLVLLSSASQAFQEPRPPAERVNADAAVIGDFKNRVTEYMKLRKKVSDSLGRLKSTTSQGKIKNHELDLAHGIREAREHARKGDIFTPEISQVVRRLIGLATQGSDGTRVGQSLKRAEPVQLKLRINREYPSALPLQSTPPSLLANLPELPKELDYRIVGHDLILRDVDANLIIDFVTNAIP
jgi:hypothetical protein